MKLKKLAIGIALGATLSGVSYGASLGEYKLNSYLGEPLGLSVQINDPSIFDEQQLKVSLGSREEYEKVGLERQFYSKDFRFKVVPQGNGYVVMASSRIPIKEPFLELLLKLEWPGGYTLREYTLLLDPREYDVKTSAPRKGVLAVPKDTAQKAAGVSGQKKRAPVKNKPTYLPTPEGKYRVVSGDTAWTVAKKVASASGEMTNAQAALWLQENNQGAFQNGNINSILEGYLVSLPAQGEKSPYEKSRAYEAFLSRASGQRYSASQPDPEYTSAAPTVSEKAEADSDSQLLDSKPESSNSAQSPQPETSAPAVEDPRLVIVDPSAADETHQGAENGVDSDELSSEQLQQLETLQDENIELQAENTDLKVALENNQKQVETVKALVEVRDRKLEELQRQISEGNDSFFSRSLFPILFGLGGIAVGVALSLFALRRKESESDEASNLGVMPEQHDPSSLQKVSEPENLSAETTDETLDDEQLGTFASAESEEASTTTEPELSSVEKLLEEAEIYLDHGQVEGAFDVFKSGLEYHNDNEQIRLRYAEALVSHGYIDEAQGHVDALEASQDPLVLERLAVLSNQLDSTNNLDLSVEEPVEEPELEDDEDDDFLSLVDNEYSLEEADQTDDQLLDSPEQKLNLASTYIEMEEIPSAKGLIEDVLENTEDEALLERAKQMLAQIS